MLRKVKAQYDVPHYNDNKNSYHEISLGLQQPRPRHIGKRKRQEILLGENKNPNRHIMDRALVSSIKFDAIIKKRDRKKLSEELTVLSKIQEGNTISSTSTSYTIGDKTKRREYQGNKVYKRQKGGKASIDIFKQALKSQKTGRWKYFSLYNECDLKGFTKINLEVIENEVDDDCETDDETMTNGLNYNRKKLLEGLQSALEKQIKDTKYDD
jgi:hypothetical protein